MRLCVARSLRAVAARIMHHTRGACRGQTSVAEHASTVPLYTRLPRQSSSSTLQLPILPLVNDI